MRPYVGNSATAIKTIAEPPETTCLRTLRDECLKKRRLEQVVIGFPKERSSSLFRFFGHSVADTLRRGRQEEGMYRRTQVQQLDKATVVDMLNT